LAGKRAPSRVAFAIPLAPRPDRDHVLVAGRKLDRTHPANSPGHAFLADSRHIGTLVQGMLANHVISALSARIDHRIEPLTVREILDQTPASSSLTVRESR
jgi:hypothetical protein